MVHIPILTIEGILCIAAPPGTLSIGRGASAPKPGLLHDPARLTSAAERDDFPPQAPPHPRYWQGSTGHPAQSQPSGFPNFPFICFALPEEIGDFDQPVAFRVGAGGR